MKKFARPNVLAALALSFVCAAVGPVRADDTSDLQTKIVRAVASAKSFATTTTIAANGLVVSSVIVAPDRVKTSIAAGTNTFDTVVIGAEVYSSQNGAPFVKSAITPQITAQLNAATHVTVSALAPDVTDGGVTYGAFRTSLPAGGRAITLNCEYDKTSFRLAKCSNEQFTVTYANYNDPKNVVEAPKDSK